MTLLHFPPPLIAVPTRPLWLDSFARWKDMGVLERAGTADHPLIVELLALAGMPTELQHDSTAWCGSSMNGAMLEAGMRGPRGPAKARNWEEWGAHLDKPRYGCVAVLWRDSLASGLGHVACWLDDAPGDNMLLLGGNQGDRVHVAQYPRNRLLSFRWPDESCLIGAEPAHA
jgi:uncharacterized protein (TIGR02594 family)